MCRLAGLVLIGAFPVGCGGSSSPPAASTPQPKPSSSSQSAPKPAAGKPALGASKLRIKDFTFLPPTVTVKAGATVRWTNVDGTNHTVTADKGGFDLGNLEKGASKSVRLTKPGVYAYHCNYHPSMHGRIVVR